MSLRDLLARQREARQRAEAAPAASAADAAAALAAERESWAAERELLLEMLAHQQRVSQAGLVTAGLAHDVGNHAQCIAGLAYIAQASDDPLDWKDALEQIQERCRELGETTRSFLAFVRRRDRAEVRSFRIAGVLEQAARLLRPLAKSAEVRLEVVNEGDGDVRGDPRLAVQALVNLASNAIRACSGKRGRVVLRCGRGPLGTCRLAVEDDGPGIPEELRGRLFRPFVTGHDNDGGNGIGLFVVRQTVRKLDGSRRVRTQRQGTWCVLDLPVVA